jgi:HK97 family phage major capsid protein
MSELQTKSLGGQDAQAVFDDMHRIFHAYQEANEERLAGLEQKLSGDVLVEEKVARIDAALDDQRRKMDRLLIEKSRPHLSSDARPTDVMSREHKSAFRSYMRTGEVAGLKTIEEKALSAGSGPDGGYLVPVPAEREILRRMANISPKK